MRTIINHSCKNSKLTGPENVAHFNPETPMLLGSQLMFSIGFYAVVPFLAFALPDDFMLGSAAEVHRASQKGRSVSLFAWLVALGEVGAAIGPLVGAVLFGWGFIVVAATGAVLFAVIGGILWLFLPSPPRGRHPELPINGECPGAPALGLLFA